MHVRRPPGCRDGTWVFVQPWGVNITACSHFAQGGRPWMLISSGGPWHWRRDGARRRLLDILGRMVVEGARRASQGSRGGVEQRAAGGAWALECVGLDTLQQPE